jgi:hypothetical protein
MFDSQVRRQFGIPTRKRAGIPHLRVGLTRLRVTWLVDCCGLTHGALPVPHSTDLDLMPKDVAELASPDAIAALLARLGYDTDDRTQLSPEAVGLTGEKAYPNKEVRDGKLDHRQWAGLQTYNGHKELVESFFDLRVLDPAMGSGHFLVETGDFVTDRILKFLNQFTINPVNFAHGAGGGANHAHRSGPRRHRPRREVGPETAGAAVPGPHRPDAVPHGGADGGRGGGAPEAARTDAVKLGLSLSGH